MWPPQANPGERMPPMARLVAVAIDKDRGSQIALKWAVDNLLVKGQTVILIHVKLRQPLTGLSTSPSLLSACTLSLSLSLSLFMFVLSVCLPACSGCIVCAWSS